MKLVSQSGGDIYQEYAADIVGAGYYERKNSVEGAKKQLASVIPKGLKTRGHYLSSIVDDQTAQRVGTIWCGESATRGDTIFIYDIRIRERYRGRGYGKAALKLVEKRARELGKERMALQVFGLNERAWKLYREVGYIATSVMMAKDL